MNFFHSRKPRGFHHEYIYVDERKEKLRELQECALHSEEDKEDSVYQTKITKGTFAEAGKHMQRRRSGVTERQPAKTIGVIVFLIILLMAIWYWLTL